MENIKIEDNMCDNNEKIVDNVKKNKGMFDYYVGWANMSRSDFYNTEDDVLRSWVTGYSTTETPIFEHSFDQNSLVFLAYKEDCVPTKITFTSGQQAMNQSLVTDNTAEHSDITIGGEVYHIWGISHPGFADYDPLDSITFNFE